MLVFSGVACSIVAISRLRCDENRYNEPLCFYYVKAYDSTHRVISKRVLEIS